MEFLVWALLLGLIPAFIAQRKGQSFVGWWVFGALLFIVALPMSIFAKKDYNSPQVQVRPCPSCQLEIPKGASVCGHCGRPVPVWASASVASEPPWLTERRSRSNQDRPNQTGDGPEIRPSGHP